jgi:hypothetical protein
MLLYWFDSDESNGSGQIAIVNQTATKAVYSDLVWDLADNSMKPTDSVFYVKVNVEIYKKVITNTDMKRYTYPGNYALSCYYDGYPTSTALIQVVECEFLNSIY